MALPTTLGNIITNPYSLGITTVAAAGTAIQAIHNFTDISKKICHYVQFQALVGNLGNIYIVIEPNNTNPPWNLPGGGTTSGADATNYLNVVYILLPGATWTVPANMLNNIFLGQFWIDASANACSVLTVVGEA